MSTKQGTNGHHALHVKRFRNINWRALIVALLVTGLAWFCWGYLSTRTNQAITQQKLHAKEIELSTKLKELESSKLNAQQLEKVKADLEAQKADLERQLQAKRNTAKVYAQSYVQPAGGVVGCGDNIYKQFIYQHESGCRTHAVNSIGCVGLGQACPGSKLPCSLSDWGCQDAWFSNYAIQRYGSWEKAYQFWLSHRWW